jgi:hypothetical protein
MVTRQAAKPAAPAPPGIEVLVAMLAEHRRDIRELQQQVSELRDVRPPPAWPIPAGYASLRDAAAETHRSVECIRLWAAGGKIVGMRRNGKWYVKMSDVLALVQRLERLEQLPNRGRPPLKGKA